MDSLFYFDTSIWLDFFEDRNEPNLPKGKWAGELIEKIIDENDKILISDAIKNELLEFGSDRYKIDSLFFPLRKILIFAHSTKKQFGKAKDLSRKRDVPLGDALHALIARDYRAILVTRDNHFSRLIDIIKKYHKPEDFI